MAKRKKSKKRGAAPKRDELTRLHVAHLRKTYAKQKKALRSTSLSESQHERVLKEARATRAKLQRYGK